MEMRRITPVPLSKEKKSHISYFGVFFSINVGKYMFGVCLPKETFGIPVACLELRSVQGNAGNTVSGARQILIF